jgi:hypothetical protein
MKPVERSELVDYETWTERRADVLPRVLAEKRLRRVHVGENLTFLFENAETMRYQIQEMMRTERIVREADILHELATYNELLGGTGQLGCTLLIEISDPVERDQKLETWNELPGHVYARLEDGERVRASFDPRQGPDGHERRLSAVQYITFDMGGRVPVAIGSDFDALTVEGLLSEAQRTALAKDLES